MHQSYPDILALLELGNAGKLTKPLWWDQNGVPRFGVHHPSLCPDIYADEVVLLLVSCQACGEEFDAQMAGGKWLHGYTGWSLAARIQNLTNGITTAPHYGDPPHHGCPTGETMNVWDLRVIEFWTRSKKSPHDWHRVPELEIELPDAKDPDR